MRRAPRAALVCLLLLGGTARGGELEQLEQRLTERGKQTRTLSAEFVQTKKLRLFRTEVTTRGRLSYQAPDHLRWETLPPDASTLLVRGNRAELRIPGERPRVLDLRRDRAMATLVEQLLVWLGARSADRLTQWYRVELGRSPPKGYRLTLRPRSAAVRKRVSQVVVTLAGDVSLRRIELSHPGGDHSTITFPTVRRNQPLPKGIFK